MFSAMIAHPHGPPVSHVRSGFGTERVSLPPNLLIPIISYVRLIDLGWSNADEWPSGQQLDDPADLARACRTCRILHFMCLPKLYKNVVLRSYDHIRYSEETAAPEGMGGASPFAMGLNTLITRNVVAHVERLALTGEWQEFGLEESAGAGRVPDPSMMLGLLVRAILERVGRLKAFTWTLNSKMLPTVWQGIALKTSLESLTIRMPSRRLPTPTCSAPALPNLLYLKVTDIDPACYPDDISELLYNARKLQHLKLHFSPRMRLEREPSVNLDSFFGKVKTSDYRMKLRTLSLQNLYASNSGNYADMYESGVIEEITMIDSSGGANDDYSMSFVSHLPIKMPPMSNLRMIRGNKVSMRHAQTLRGFAKQLQKYFLITGRELKDVPLTGSPSTSMDDGFSPGSTPYSYPASVISTPRSLPDIGPSSGRRTSSSINVPTKPSRADNAVASLLTHYMDSLCVEMRPRITHILLLPQWKLSRETVQKIVGCIPKLKEFGFALDGSMFDILRSVVHYLPHLTALRILDSQDDWDLGEDPTMKTEWFELKIGANVWHQKYDSLRWVGVGDLVFEVLRGTAIEVEIEGQKRLARVVRRVPLKRVRDVELWSNDRLEI